MESKSGAAWISARTAVEEVIAPVVGLAVLNVVATWLLRESSYVLRRPEAVGFSNNLNVTKVAGFAKALAGEVAAAHLSGSMLAVGFRVYDFAAPFDHGGAVGEI